MMDPLTHEQLCLENELKIGKLKDPRTHEQLCLRNELKISKLKDRLNALTVMPGE